MIDQCATMNSSQDSTPGKTTFATGFISELPILSRYLDIKRELVALLPKASVDFAR